jgi:hypothetical protein
MLVNRTLGLFVVVIFLCLASPLTVFSWSRRGLSDTPCGRILATSLLDQHHSMAPSPAKSAERTSKPKGGWLPLFGPCEAAPRLLTSVTDQPWCIGPGLRANPTPLRSRKGAKQNGCPRRHKLQPSIFTLPDAPRCVWVAPYRMRCLPILHKERTNG